MYRFCFLFAIFILISGCKVNAEISELDITVERIPSYWKSYLDNKESVLRNAEASINRQGVSFAFITDVHVGSNNMKSPSLLKYLTNHKLISKIVCGGDIVYEYHLDKNDALGELSAWSDSIAPLKVPTLLGNHDLNSNNQIDESQILGINEFYDIVCKDKDTQVIYVNGKIYGYEDDDALKVRFIYLNIGAPDAAIIDEAQLAWMKERIIELEEGWTVVVFCHQFWTGDSLGKTTLQEDSNGIAIEKALDKAYNMAQATIACVITGHCHRNYSKKSGKGYPIIATTCDTGGVNSERYDPDTPYRLAGTTSEQAFDIYYLNTNKRHIDVVRIGAGDTIMDRSFDY